MEYFPYPIGDSNTVTGDVSRDFWAIGFERETWESYWMENLHDFVAERDEVWFVFTKAEENINKMG